MGITNGKECTKSVELVFYTFVNNRFRMFQTYSNGACRGEARNETFLV